MFRLALSGQPVRLTLWPKIYVTLWWADHCQCSKMLGFFPACCQSILHVAIFRLGPITLFKVNAVEKIAAQRKREIVDNFNSHRREDYRVGYGEDWDLVVENCLCQFV